MGYTFGLGLFTGRRMAAPVSASVVTFSVQPQDGENIAVSYTVTAGTTCAVLLYEATEAAPAAASFAGGGAPFYIDLGSVGLTPDGVDITLDLPDELDGSYKLALLPAGGNDIDVAESDAVTLDTRIATGPTPINAPYLSGVLAPINGSSLAASRSGTLDMSAHDGSSRVLLIGAAYMGHSDEGIAGFTLDGNSAPAVFTQLGTRNPGLVLGYAIVPGGSFAAMSLCELTVTRVMYYGAVMAYSIPDGATVSVLADQSETQRDGSVLGGIITTGSAVIAAHFIENMTTQPSAGWGALSQDYIEIEPSNDEYILSASAGNIATSPILINPEGEAGKYTTGLSLEVSA